MSNLEKYYWLTCPSCYKPVKKLYLDYVAYTRCNWCGKVWFQEGKGLPVMSVRQQAHYQNSQSQTRRRKNIMGLV